MTGSAFHLSAFAPPRARLIRLNPVTVIHSNHVLLDRLNGEDAVHLHQTGTAPDPDAVVAALLAVLPGHA